MDDVRNSALSYYRPQHPMSSNISLICLFTIFCLSWSSVAQAADAGEWSAGIASIKITPQKPVPLAGYAGRVKPFESVDQDIHAKALALADSDNHRALLITVDLCVLPRDVSRIIHSRVAEKTAID